MAFRVVPADLVVSGKLTGAYTLSGEFMESPNYVPGVSGWGIFGDGSAEFNNLTIRGTFNGTDFVINTAGIFFYNGTPAAGNLILAIAQTAGADGFGNPYIKGVNVGAAGTQQVQMLVSGLLGLLRFPSGASFEQGIATIEAAVGGSSPAQFVSMLIQSASTTTAGAHDSVIAGFNSAAADNSSSANLEFVYVGSNGTPHEQAFLDINGFTILAGSIVGVDPGSSPATPAGWHTIALQNGYTAGTNNGFVDVPQVRQAAENKRLEFKGSLTVPAAPNIVWGLLPAGFPNANFGGPFGLGSVSNYSGGTTDHIQVQNNSNLSLNNAAAHAGITFNLCCQVPTQ